jgi:glycerol uptake facilitator-like aquaporin
MLFVLITMLGPISGAHMNPAVSLVAASRRELRWTDAAAYIVTQLAFGILGAWAAHRMFDLPTLQLSVKARGGVGKALGEAIATFGLILTILGTVRFRREWVAPSVALYITAAYAHRADPQGLCGCPMHAAAHRIAVGIGHDPL